MPPRRKSRRTAGPEDDIVSVQFVPDPVEIPPQAAVEASTSGVGSEGLSDAMVSSIVAAVKTAIQSTNAAQNSSSPLNLVADAVQQDVASITNTPVRAVESSGVVPKKTPGEFRLIHHLSYPDGSSVNDFIPDQFSSVQYASIGDAITLIKSLGRACYMAKTDIKSAFRIIPIHPDDYHLMGMTWNNSYFFDRCLPMGCSSSCAIFEAFSTALEWLAKHYLCASGVLHILDDFLFIASSQGKCASDLSNFLGLCDRLGVPIAHEKTEGPSTTLQFAGITLDTINMEARLPDDKLRKCNAQLLDMHKRRKTTLKELQSLIGLLNFTCSVVLSGRAFLRRLIDLTKGVRLPHHRIRITEACRRDLQKASRGHRNVLIDKLQAQDVQELIHRPVMCSQQYHEDQPLEFYCEDCKVLICHKCTVVSHDRHFKTDTQKAAQEQKMQMSDAVAKVKAEIVRYESEIKKQTDLRNKNKVEILNEEKKMTDTVEKLIRDLREHERKMKAKFHEIYEAEQKHHATRLENFELVATQLKSCLERCQSILNRNFSVEILQTNHAILGRCNELLNVRKPDLYMSPLVHYLVEKKLDLMDRVVVTKTDPSKCLAEGQDSKEVKQSKETYFVIVTKDSEEFQCFQQDDKIKVNILTPEGDQLKTDIKDTKDGKYTVAYTPQDAGQHRLEVLVNGQPMTGSPWIVQVHQHQYQFAFQFGSQGKRRGQFHGIYDIDVSQKTGTIAVADSRNRRIQLFSSEGKFRREVRLNGVPFSVAFTDSGNLLTLIPESDNKLRLFSEEGHLIKQINDKHLDDPCTLFIASDGRIIITDYGDKKIKVLSPDGNDLLQSFSAPDCDEFPFCAIYYQNKFFVSYVPANCVKVFDRTGVYLLDIGCKGSNDGQFFGCRGLVIDKYNRLIVCDTSNHRLQLFTRSGKFLSKIDGHYFKNGFPIHVAINSGGSLIVGDHLNNRISVFH
ncbi:tripartite motif-containing protein 2-like [Montipora foliosa]|uniref:tripartite motif-containing protein 2-like n=1 Tax=Montipora foliosa TaxID=591990 RepID=UPI0035F1C6CC